MQTRQRRPEHTEIPFLRGERHLHLLLFFLSIGSSSWHESCLKWSLTGCMSVAPAAQTPLPHQSLAFEHTVRGQSALSQVLRTGSWGTE